MLIPDILINTIENLLFIKANKGIRPTLYFSSEKDVECTLLMLSDICPFSNKTKNC